MRFEEDHRRENRLHSHQLLESFLLVAGEINSGLLGYLRRGESASSPRPNARSRAPLRGAMVSELFGCLRIGGGGGSRTIQRIDST